MSRPRCSRRSRRRARGEEGQALVEFAIVLPVLCLLLFGIMQFGLLFYNYIDLTSATRDGARRVAVARASNLTVDDVKSTIASSTTVVRDDDTTVDVSPGPDWTAGEDVHVKVKYPYKLNVMGVVVWSGSLTAESIARIE
jgi:Flp pilus assembly protein TadG